LKNRITLFLKALLLPLGALLLPLWLGCAADTAAISAADPIVNSAEHSHHDPAAGGIKGSSGKHYHGNIVLDSNAPSSFAERPEEGTHFTCPVSGGVFEIESHTRGSVYEGRYYAFCCGGCAQDFDADPVFFVNRLKKAESEL
jgi:YHS domain-containing protein